MDYTIKMILLGEGNVGKTSLLMRYHKNEFNDKHNQTKQVYFVEKKIPIDLDRVTLRCWDTGGQEKFHSLHKVYYQGSHAALLLYAINDKESFERVKLWVNELKKFCPGVIISIVGAKCDLSKEKKVKKEEVDKYCSIMNKTNLSVEHIITSAKANKNVNAAFFNTVKRVMSKQFQKRGKKSSGGMYGYQRSSVSSYNKKQLSIVDDDDEPSLYDDSKKCCCFW